MLSKNFYYEDNKFEVEVEFKALCCGYVFKKGEILTVGIHTTSNRLLVLRKDGGWHNVKRSTLNRCCELREKGSYESKNKEIT